MKILGLLSLLLLPIAALAQVGDEASLEQYIENQEEYVRLSENPNTPALIRPFLPSIKRYMEAHKMDFRQYWIWTSYVGEDSTTVTIPICHVDGFEVKRQLELENREANKDRKEGEPLIVRDMVGNASGKDGNFEVDKTTKEILSFGLWQ